MNHRNTREQRGSKNNGRQAGNTLVGLFVGLVLGIVIAAGVVWYLNRSHSPFQDKGLRTSGPAVVAPAGTAPASASSGESPQPSVSSNGAPDSLPAKPGDKQRFDFYNILPGGSDGAPAPKAAPPASAASAAPAAPSNDQYFLQAGAFQSKAEADNLKARLALIGIDSTLSETTVQDKGKMYRVRTGPYAKVEDMNLARTQMSQGGIQATVVKTSKN